MIYLLDFIFWDISLTVSPSRRSMMDDGEQFAPALFNIISQLVKYRNTNRNDERHWERRGWRRWDLSGCAFRGGFAICCPYFPYFTQRVVWFSFRSSRIRFEWRIGQLETQTGGFFFSSVAVGLLVVCSASACSCSASIPNGMLFALRGPRSLSLLFWCNCVCLVVDDDTNVYVCCCCCGLVHFSCSLKYNTQTQTYKHSQPHKHSNAKRE